MQKSQHQVSTGLRVERASDNAAYWSIATTMRSDNRALSAVSDALGLAAAKVDTSYAGLELAADVLADFKALLVSATEAGIDKQKVQDQLEQLKGQLQSSAVSSSFNGVNWLNTTRVESLIDVSDFKDELTSSFTRSADGSVTVGSTSVDIGRIALFNTGGGGALQADVRSLGDIGGLRDASIDSQGVRGYEQHPFSAVTFSSTDSISFDLTLDASAHSPGIPYTVTINKAIVDSALGTTTGAVSTSAEFAFVLREAFDAVGATGAGAGYNTNPTWNVFAISSYETTGELGSGIGISNITTTFAGGFAAGLEKPSWQTVNNLYAQGSFGFSQPFNIHRDTTFSFALAINGAAQSFTVDRAMVDVGLGTTDGKINTADDMALVLNAALQSSDVIATSNGAVIKFEMDATKPTPAGSRSKLELLSVVDNIGVLPDFDLMDVDITGGASLSNYLSGVEGMLKKVTSSAAYLGSVGSRIASADEFTKRLIDSTTSGIGRLVDADMETVSTRMTALQTQQRLAIQSLSIANQAPQTVLQLFQ
ncbi:flagellin [Rhizobium gallicum]|uniref:flagellin N-terminal helical domain-containing protein n=1 Tax=Rhizobium gallicum TaxID=56730 RepID=UPI001F1AA5FF|nr:flagellin [Rhizobium gallicum]